MRRRGTNRADDYDLNYDKLRNTAIDEKSHCFKGFSESQ